MTKVENEEKLAKHAAMSLGFFFSAGGGVLQVARELRPAGSTDSTTRRLGYVPRYLPVIVPMYLRTVRYVRMYWHPDGIMYVSSFKRQELTMAFYLAISLPS